MKNCIRYRKYSILNHLQNNMLFYEILFEYLLPLDAQKAGSISIKFGSKVAVILEEHMGYF